MTALTPERVRALFDYNPTTGKLTWRERPVSDFSSELTAKRWNGRLAGKIAGTPHKWGYECVRIDCTQYRSHRIIFLWVHGYMPVEVDHINQNRSDNRIINLRAADPKINGRNRGIPRDNSSGAVGVFWSQRREKWIAEIVVDGRKIYIGQFCAKEEAVEARRFAQDKHGFYANHGCTAK